MTERGSAPIEFAVGTLVLLIPIAVLVLSFGPVLERRVLARSLAVEVARVIVLTDGGDTAAITARLQEQAMASGVPPHAVRVAACAGEFRELPGGLEGCEMRRPEAVEVTVTIAVDGWLPGGPDTVSYTHWEPVGPYRSRP